MPKKALVKLLPESPRPVLNEPRRVVMPEIGNKVPKRLKGGPGSGHRGHVGRPGKVGGSLPGEGVSKLAAGSAIGYKPQRYEYENDAKGREHLNEDLPDTWDSASIEVRKVVKDIIVSDVSEESGLGYDVVNGVVGGWAGTSNNSPDAVSLQHAVSEEFGVPLNNWQQKKWDKFRPEDVWYSVTSQDDLRKIARAMYDRTQAGFRKQGLKAIDTITLFRGIGNQDAGPGGEVARYFGNTIESWSIDYGVATGFVENGDVIGMKVPVGSIFSTARTGLGALIEGEFVIFGSIGHEVRILDLD